MSPKSIVGRGLAKIIRLDVPTQQNKHHLYAVTQHYTSVLSYGKIIHCSDIYRCSGCRKAQLVVFAIAIERAGDKLVR